MLFRTITWQNRSSVTSELRHLHRSRVWRYQSIEKCRQESKPLHDQGLRDLQCDDSNRSIRFQCPPLAYAIAEHCKNSKNAQIPGKLEFSVIELANKIGWKSGTVKNELKRSEWTEGENYYHPWFLLRIFFVSAVFQTICSNLLSFIQLMADLKKAE